MSLGCSGLIEHDSSKIGGVRFLKVLDNLLCLIGLQIHYGVNDIVRVVRRGQAQVDLSLLVRSKGVHEVDPVRKSNVRALSSIVVIEVRASATFSGVVKLYEEKIKDGCLNGIGEMCIWDNALRSARNIVRLVLE